MSRRQKRRIKRKVSNLSQHVVPRRIVVHRETGILTPELYYSVYLAPESQVEARLFIEMFVRGYCHKANTPDEADLVVFGGGADVNPVLYGESRHSSTKIDRERDESDILLYEECLAKGIPMFGVCRGAQFLHVMNGGKLYQDVAWHNSSHAMTEPQTGKTFTVSSVHHQMCKENEKMEVLGYCSGLSEHRALSDKVAETGKIKEVEAFFYRDTGCFGVQGHPEYPGYPTFTAWCMQKMVELFDNNPDFELRNNFRRLREDVIHGRQNTHDDLWALIEEMD